MEIIQSVFYTLASVFMLLGVFFMIFLVLIVWKAYQAVQQAQRSIAEMKENVGEKVVEFVASRPMQVAQVVGAGFSSFIINKIKEAFTKKDSS